MNQLSWSTYTKILVVDFWSASPHLETSLEICLRLLKEGKEVYYLFLGDVVPLVECHWSTKRVDTGLSRVVSALSTKEKNNFKYVLLNDIDTVADFVWPEFACLQELKLYSWKLKPIGISAVSTITDLCKSDDIDFSRHDVQTLAIKALSTFALAYEITTATLHSYKPDALVLFNGRFPSYAGSRYAAIDQDIAVFYHERGANPYCYSLKSNPPHDYWAFRNNCLAHAKRSFLDLLANESVSDHWFATRTKISDNDIADTICYLNERSSCNTIPGTIYSFFVSSTDELASLPSDTYPSHYWPSQITAICDLISAICTIDSRALLVIRLHPNMMNKDPDQISRYNFLSLIENVVLIEAQNKLNSYALAHVSKTVFTYMSTMGLEAAYMGRPVVTMAPAYYDFLRVTYPVKSYKELVRFLKCKDADYVPSSISSIKMRCSLYSSFLTAPQEYYRYYKAQGSNSGTFLGAVL